MKFLVTGVNGFIGSNLAKKLVEENHEVRGLILEGTDESNLEKFADKIEKVYGNITDPDSIHHFFEGIDVVVHLAARASDWGSEKRFQKINVEGSKNVLNAAIDAGVKRFIFMSSLAVHGFKGFQNADEETPYDPYNAYARSKRDVEGILNATLAQNKIEIVIIRPGFNIIGPFDRLDGLIIFDRIEKGKSVPLSGKGNAQMCYSCAENLVDGIILVATHPAATGTYIITDGPLITTRELYEHMFKAAGREPKIISFPYWLAITGVTLLELFCKLIRKKERPILTKYVVKLATTDLGFTNEKIVKELGYKATISIEEGFRQTYEWFKEELGKLE